MSNGKLPMEYYRKPNYEINPVFINRWSPRSYFEKDVPDHVLYGLFEAARWAPSANNRQPWSFIIARNGEDRQKFHSFINDSNVVWCSKAPVLVLILSKTISDSGNANRTHAFDTGAAWSHLALAAAGIGLITHAMGGFDRDKAREVLQVPAEYELHAVVAIGYQGEKAALPEDLQEREQPNSRRPLNETVFEGGFGQTIASLR